MTTFGTELHITFDRINWQRWRRCQKQNTLLNCFCPVADKGGYKMRESIIERILALTDEQVKELITLLRQSEAEDLTSANPRQTSA